MSLRVGIAVGVVAAISGAVVLWLSLGEAPEPPAPPPVAVPEPPVEAPAPGKSVTVKSIKGDVEAQDGDDWIPAIIGQTLSEDQSVRTLAGGEAVLAIDDDDTQVIVRDKSEVSVRQVTNEVARVRLERGRLGADLKGKLKLQVESAGSNTVAESKAGKFSVYNNGRGLIAVAAETGGVKLKTPKGERVLAVGQQVTVDKDTTSKPEKIPPAVFLNVVWPEERLTRAKSVKLRGKASPGAEVELNGKRVKVGSNGTFTTDVSLAEGDNTIVLEAKDVLGRAQRSKRTISARRRGPKVKANSESMWK